MYLSMILLSASNDIELNPGPSGLISNTTTYPCGTCDKPVTREDGWKVCDNCNQWYHAHCQSSDTHLILPRTYVNDSAIAWDCTMCGCSNYSTFGFSLVFSTSNHFSVLSYTPLESPVPSRNLKPVHSSTPDTSKKHNLKEQNTLGMLNVNFQSIKTKQRPHCCKIQPHQLTYTRVTNRL